MISRANLPPWLIIVQRDAETLYQHLRQAFESDPQVRVIKDRRFAERRLVAAPVASERRKSDRRAAPPVRDEKIWHSLRFRLIHRDEQLMVYQSAEELFPAAQATATSNAGARAATRGRGGRGARRGAGSSRPARRRRLP